jgi:hypothetical protein
VKKTVKTRPKARELKTALSKMVDSVSTGASARFFSPGDLIAEFARRHANWEVPRPTLYRLIQQLRKENAPDSSSREHWETRIAELTEQVIQLRVQNELLTRQVQAQTTRGDSITRPSPVNMLAATVTKINAKKRAR